MFGPKLFDCPYQGVVALVLQIFHLQVIEAQGTSPMLGWFLSMNVIEEEKIMYDET